MYKNFIKPLLFLFSPETAHRLTTRLLRFSPIRSVLKNMLVFEHPMLERNIFGLHFKNPVGLAAGFDKNAAHIDELAHMGFGFIEIGTVTPLPQSGNPQPRLFRLPEDEALINRMGFNNDGVAAVVENLKKRTSEVIIGGNIGKNKITPNAEANHDYQICYEALYPVVDYFVVNVSSPNTPGLRALQEKEPLKQLLSMLKELNKAKPAPKPILLKIAPDLTTQQLDDIVEICQEVALDGIIATNTTISREHLHTDHHAVEKMGAGGLSGQPLRKRATEVIRYLSEKTQGKLPIIGVGGIALAKDVIEKLEAGACLVQVYTGFIYEGPAMVKKIKKELLAYYTEKKLVG